MAEGLSNAGHRLLSGAQRPNGTDVERKVRRRSRVAASVIDEVVVEVEVDMPAAVEDMLVVKAVEDTLAAKAEVVVARAVEGTVVAPRPMLLDRAEAMEVVKGDRMVEIVAAASRPQDPAVPGGLAMM